MYYKPSEIWNIEHARNVIRIIEAILRYSESNGLKDLPELRVYAEKAIDEWNQKIKDEINSLLQKRQQTIVQPPRIFLS